MLPVENTYGPWPMSGSLGLFPRELLTDSPSQVRLILWNPAGMVGVMPNSCVPISPLLLCPKVVFHKRGQNYVRGSIHWGPLTWLNQVTKTVGYWSERRGSYADKFHTYTLEWTEKFMYDSFVFLFRQLTQSLLGGYMSIRGFITCLTSVSIFRFSSVDGSRLL
jgi:hypothetical protein